MPKVREIFDFIDSFAPFERQCEWDNSGLLVGNCEQEVTTVAVALDITPEVVEFAKRRSAQLVVSHHPVIFKPRTCVVSNDPVYMLANAGISAICAHTSLDIAAGGVNDALTAKLGFGECEPLTGEGETAMIRVAFYDKAVTVGEIARLTAQQLKTGVRVCDCSNAVRKIAFCAGEGTDFIPDVAAADCDLFITGDCRHHDFLEARQLGLSVIAAGHFETENPVVEVLARKLSEKFSIKAEIMPAVPPCITVI